jgi:hypothetical protein
MTVRVDSAGVIVIEGQSPVEDAELLLQYLDADPGARVDCSRCEVMHTAVLQVLLASTPPIVGRCGDRFVEAWRALGKAPIGT